ncbi:MFS transporter [Lachnospiraceae bacterium OttesenSCG-928-D06]|nr:MFS transporter [Lachnospiraceae bacterium OttesenSCG-928-D06]
MEASNNIQYRKAAIWRLILWPLSGGVNNMFVILMVFTSYVAAGGYGIAVTVAGLIATSSRIFDAITDPIIALVADKLNTKFGRIRILLAAGFAIMAAAVLIIFFWGLGKGIVVYTLAYMLYIIGYTIFGVAQSIGNPVMTNEPKQRMLQARWKTVWTQVFAVAVSSYMSIVLAPKYGGLAMGAFQEMCITCVIVGSLLVIISMVAISPYDKMENFASGKKEPVTFKDCLNLIKGNRAIWAFIAAASSDKLALQSASQSAVTTMIFGIIIGNYAFNGSLNLIMLVPTLLIIFYATKLRGKGDTKSMMIRWTFIAIALAALMVIYMAVIDTTKISVSPVYTGIFMVLFCLFNGAKVVTSVFNNAMLPDVVDYELYRSGSYLPATVSAVYSFIDKLISSLATTVVSFCVAAIGYTTAMPQISDPSSPQLFWMAMFLWMGLPILGWICTQIAMIFYPLDGEMMKKIQQANYETRKKAQ